MRNKRLVVKWGLMFCALVFFSPLPCGGTHFPKQVQLLGGIHGESPMLHPNPLQGTAFQSAAFPEAVTEFADAGPGNALDFDGENDYVDLGGALIGLKNYTFELWLKTSTANTVIFSCINSNNKWDPGEKVLILDANGRPVFQGNGNGSVRSKRTIADGRWHHLAITRTTSNINRIYIDGKDETDVSAIYSWRAEDVGSFFLGKATEGPNSGLKPFKGMIDEVRFWNYARAQEDLQKSMYVQVEPSTTGLVAYYRFDQGSDSGNNWEVDKLVSLIPGNPDGSLKNFRLTGETSNWMESYAMVVPVVLTPEAVKAKEFTARWEAPRSGAVTSYIVEVATDPDFTTKVVGFEAQEVGLSESIRVIGLLPESLYYYRVRANKNEPHHLDNTGGYSMAMSVMTTAEPSIPEPPEKQSSEITVVNQGPFASRVTWTRGSGSGVAVFMAEETAERTVVPTDGTKYTGDPSFGSGSQVGETGWYCVFLGDASSVLVDELSPGKSYQVAVFEYNTNGEDVTFNLSIGALNRLGFTTSKVPQSISFEVLADKVYGDPDFSPGARSNTLLPIHYESSDPLVARIVDGKVRIVGAGTVTITAMQGGDAMHEEAVAKSQILTVRKRLIEVYPNEVRKVYDATDVATVVFPVLSASSGLVGEDEVAIDYTSARFDDPNVGTEKAIEIEGLRLVGRDSRNYSLKNFNVQGVIEPLEITAEFTVADKIYDGKRGAEITSRTIKPLASDIDSLQVEGGAARFEDENAGSGKQVHITGMVLAGSAALNYRLLEQSSATASIHPLEIEGLVTVADKIYDGTKKATINSRTLIGGIAADTASLRLTGGIAEFVDRNAGTGKAVAITGGMLTGSAASNYRLISVTGSTASILPKPVVVTAEPKRKLYGQPDPLFNYKINTELIEGDSFSGSPGRIASENVGRYHIVQKDLRLNSNYSIIFQGAELVIEPAPLRITANNAKRYEGTDNPDFAVSYDGFVRGEDSSVLQKLPNVTTTASKGSPPGNYPLEVGGALAENYVIEYKAGVLKVVSAPTVAVAIATDTLFENAPPGTRVATIVAKSDDRSAIFRYLLVDGAEDNKYFHIDGSEIKTTGALDYEHQSRYSIRIRILNQYGFSFDHVTTVNLEDINDPPAIPPILDQSVCYSSEAFAIQLGKVTAGPEIDQQVRLAVDSSYPELFETLSISDQGILTFSAKKEGEATIRITAKDSGGTANGGADTSSRSFKLKVLPIPRIAIRPDKGSTSISKGESVLLTATGGEKYKWMAIGVEGDSGAASLQVRPQKTTTYKVIGFSEAGCSAEQEITIEVKEDYLALEQTNIVTPNGDGVNDNFIIKNIDMYPENEVKIFDTAGRLLYRKKNYKDEWDGTFEGAPLAEGTYYYIVDFGAVARRLKGYISIVRD